MAKKRDPAPHAINDESFEEVHSQCVRCAYRHKDKPTCCDAFPEGIPVIILAGHYDHRYPYIDPATGLVTDRGLRYFPQILEDKESLDKSPEIK